MLTDRQNGRPAFVKMLTQQAKGSDIENYRPSETTLKKQKTQCLTNKEQQASDNAKQAPPAKTTMGDNNLN